MRRGAAGKDCCCDPETACCVGLDELPTQALLTISGATNTFACGTCTTTLNATFICDLQDPPSDNPYEADSCAWWHGEFASFTCGPGVGDAWIKENIDGSWNIEARFTDNSTGHTYTLSETVTDKPECLASYGPANQLGTVQCRNAGSLMHDFSLSFAV